MLATQVPGKRNNNLEIRIAGSSDRLQIVIRPASDLIPETPSSCWICLRWEITIINSVYFILPLLAIISHLTKQITGFGTHVGILSFKRLTPNEYIRQLCNRVRILLSSSNSMTFHDFFHHLFTFSMALCLAITFKKVQNIPCFRVFFDLKYSLAYTNSGVHKNACLSPALFNYSTLSYIDLALSSAVTNVANKK